MVERPGRPADHKRRLLLANAPRRTITALDEAAVVASLTKDDLLGPQAIAHLLGHRQPWVDSRLRLDSGLSPHARQRLARRAIGPALADALSACGPDDQDGLLAAIERHGLRDREARTLCAAYQVADAADRRALVADPLAAGPHAPTQAHAIAARG